MTQSYKAIVDDFSAGLKQAPQEGKVTFAAESRQIEGLCSEVSIRDFKLLIDEPPSLAGSDQGPNPVELVLASLAACQEITYRLYADRLEIPLDGVSVRIEGDLDLSGFFAVDDEVRPGYTAIKAKVTLDSPASDDDLARLKAEVDRHCPVLDILRNPTPVALDLEVDAEAGRSAA